MKKIVLLLITMNISFTSCNKISNKEKNNPNSNDGMNNYFSSDSIYEEQIEAQNIHEKNLSFSIVELNEAGFKNKKEYFGGGPSFFYYFFMRNNTNQDITQFQIKYFIVLTYENGSKYFLPLSLYDESKTEVTEKVWETLGIPITSTNLEYAWESGTQRRIKFECFSNYLPGWEKSNFSNKDFERTPVEAFLCYKYYATGIDGEFEDIGKIEILNYWKEYQKELGLRK